MTGFSLELRTVTITLQLTGELMHDFDSLVVLIVSKCTAVRVFLGCGSADIILLPQSFLECDDLVLHK